MFTGITEINSPGWNSELIYHYITRTTEGHSYDRKGMIKVIRVTISQGIDQEYLDNIKDYVMDVIAMANTARRRGHPCFIVFGVDNEWKFAPTGILDQSTRPIKNRDKYKEFRSNPLKFETLQKSIIAQDFCHIAAEYIDPEPDIDYEFGWIQHQGECLLIGYIEFNPVALPQPFRVKNHKNLKILDLEEGSCWTRRADENWLVVGKAIDTLVSWREIPFISLKEWKIYLEQLIQYLQKQELHKYKHPRLLKLTPQDINFINKSGQLSTGALLKELESFVYGEENGTNAIFVTGLGGTGKSITLLQLTEKISADLSDQLSIELHSKFQEEPKGKIPIFADLKNFRPSQEEIETYIISCLRGIHFSNAENFNQMLRDTNLQFVVLLDSLDEIFQAELELAITQIDRLVRYHQRTKFIVATRPGIVEEAARSYRLLDTEPLHINQIAARLRELELPLDSISTLLRMLEQDQHLLQLLRIPRMLDGYIVQSESTQITALGNIVKQVITTFLDHERRILGYVDYQKFDAELLQLSQMAWQKKVLLYGELSDFYFVKRLVQTGILQENHRDANLTFTSPYILHYLLAREIQNNTTIGQKYVLDILGNTQRYSTVIRFLANWTNKSLSDWELGSSIAGTNEPILILKTYLERVNPFLADASDIYLALAETSNYFIDPDSNNTLTNDFVLNLLVDPSDTVFKATTSALLDFDTLLNKVDVSFLSDLFMQETNNVRRINLWSLVNKKSPKPVVKWLEELAFSVDASSNQDILTQLLESDELIWTEGYPTDLVSLFTAAVPLSVQLAVLHKMIRVPDRLRQDLEELTTHQNAELSDEAHRVLGLDRPSVIVVTGEQEKDSGTYISSTIIQFPDKE